MPLNYRKNSVTCSAEYYQNVSDLNGPGVCGSNRINIRSGGITQYIGLVASGHDQASDLSVRVGSSELRLVKRSKFTTCTFGWGINGAGEIGNGTTAHSCVPVAVCCGPFCITSNGFSSFSLALKNDGSAWGWGNNQYGQLGDATIVSKCCPVAVFGGHVFCTISAGRDHSAALKSDGTAWAWGTGLCGALGNGGTTDRCCPVAVSGGHVFCAIGAANYFTLALRADGCLFSWGVNGNGVLGDGTVTTRTSPVAVPNHLFCAIGSHAESTFSLALKANGTAWAWGLNGSGQLGIGISGAGANRCVPVSVCGGHVFCAISAGTTHSLALKSDGSVYAWGSNENGQLGDGTIANKCVPVLISGHLFCAISAGSNISLALKTDGSAWAWGRNTCGALGDGTTVNKCVPTAVFGGRIFCAISTGASHSFAISCHWLSPSTLSYPSNYVLPLISTSVSYTPTLTNLSGTVTYSISPSLPAGLNFNTSNGVISGTTPSSTNDTEYTVTASSSNGSVSTNIRIRIVYVNTTMTIGSNIDGEGFGTIGYENGFYGSLISNTFRNGIIIALVESVDSYGNNYGGISFTINISLSNTDNASFKQIVWNEVTYLRSNFDYYTTSVNETQWGYTAAIAPFDPVTFLNNGTPTTVSLIIE
jgi:alpha-tubulin suppressor-like RCC1 family protein